MILCYPLPDLGFERIEFGDPFGPGYGFLLATQISANGVACYAYCPSNFPDRLSLSRQFVYRVDGTTPYHDFLLCRISTQEYSFLRGGSISLGVSGSIIRLILKLSVLACLDKSRVFC